VIVIIVMMMVIKNNDDDDGDDNSEVTTMYLNTSCGRAAQAYSTQLFTHIIYIHITGVNKSLHKYTHAHTRIYRYLNTSCPVSGTRAGW
jgi:hypothetical protein